MGNPSITQRKHVRLVRALPHRSFKWTDLLQVPGEAKEPTSTIVLTSQTSHYVDVRVYKEPYQKVLDEGQPLKSEDSLEWAFAGISSTTMGVGKSGSAPPVHSIWEHWIDSKTENPQPDEGDMWPQENGDVLERGTQIHPVTGLQTEYEELWGDMEIEGIVNDNERVSVVLKLEVDDGKSTRGMIVRIGRWCQGILKSGGSLTVQRLHWNTELNKWDTKVDIGHGSLPSLAACYDRLFEGKSTYSSPNGEWKFVEVFRW